MAIKAVVFNQFSGGWSTDLKIGVPHSQAYTQSLDFRKSPSQLTVLPGLAKESGSIITDLIQNFVRVPDGTIYTIGDTGNFYKRTTAGVWSLIGNTGTAGFGLDYRSDTDNIYISGTTTVHLYGPLANSPKLVPDKYGSSLSTYNNSATMGFNVSASQGSTSPSGFTYTPPTAVSETVTNLRFFQSDIEPLVNIQIYILNKGTGAWTVTVHDGLNNVLATATATNASLTNNSFNTFTLTPTRLYVYPNARTYHIHVTSTIADGKLTTTTNGDLRGADLQISANRLIATNNGYHPLARFLEFECFGNGNYLSVWEPLSDPPTNAEWVRHRLQFPQEYEVCGLAVFNEYLAIALQKISTSTTSDPQEGLIAFWDGLSTDTTSIHPNYFVQIPEGTPQCIQTYKNAVYYYASGAWYRIASPTAQPEKIWTLPNSDTEFSGSATTINIYPYASALRRGILLMAYPSTTTSTSINYGVYSWGAINRNFPDSFGFSYPLSTGTLNYTASNNLKIGAVSNFGDTLLVSWRDDTYGYGVDSVTNASAPTTVSHWESWVLDNGAPSKTKTAMYTRAWLPNFPADASIVLKYKIDRGSWVYSNSFTTTDVGNDGTVRFDVSAALGNRYHEIQIGFDLTAGTTTPTEAGMVFVYNNDAEEVRF